MMRPFAILILSLPFFISCRNQVANTAVKNNLNDSSGPKRSATINSIGLGLIDDEFLSFWGQFRTAVIEFDTVEIKKLTRFPLRTSGDLDSDPVDKRQFFRVFR